MAAYEVEWTLRPQHLAPGGKGVQGPVKKPTASELVRAAGQHPVAPSDDGL
ncbi:hypothetical protein ACICHK_34640 [Streptomyces sp. AHU1]|uniref:hypothetical protein n=1 Tax=Streptomyces sp. AHU1 TaxID=3377215 RepID=UPI0038782722